MNIIAFIIIGIVAGLCSEKIVRGRGFGFVGDSVLGITGGLIGGTSLGPIGQQSHGLPENIVMAAIGAFVLLFVANQFWEATNHEKNI